MKYNAYDTVTAVVKSWTSKARSSNIRSTKRNSNFASMPAYKSIRKYEKVGAMLGIKSPFFRAIGGRVGNSCIIDGRKVINFAWCDYLGLNQHPSLAAAAEAATDEYRTCV